MVAQRLVGTAVRSSHTRSPGVRSQIVNRRKQPFAGLDGKVVRGFIF